MFSTCPPAPWTSVSYWNLAQLFVAAPEQPFYPQGLGHGKQKTTTPWDQFGGRPQVLGAFGGHNLWRVLNFEPLNRLSQSKPQLASKASHPYPQVVLSLGIPSTPRRSAYQPCRCFPPLAPAIIAVRAACLQSGV